MSNVTLRIGGLNYTVACASGEEDHIRELGTMIDSKLENLPNASAQGEARMLLFASLFLADELSELKRQKQGTPAEPPVEFVETIEQIATRLENIASTLEG